MTDFEPVRIAESWLISTCGTADSVEDLFDECRLNSLARSCLNDLGFIYGVPYTAFNFQRLCKAFRRLSDNRAWLDSLPR